MFDRLMMNENVYVDQLHHHRMLKDHVDVVTKLSLSQQQYDHEMNVKVVMIDFSTKDINDYHFHH
jgi:hypothetical protein